MGLIANIDLMRRVSKLHFIVIPSRTQMWPYPIPVPLFLGFVEGLWLEPSARVSLECGVPVLSAIFRLWIRLLYVPSFLRVGINKSRVQLWNLCLWYFAKKLHLHTLSKHSVDGFVSILKTTKSASKFQQNVTPYSWLICMWWDFYGQTVQNPNYKAGL